MVEDIVTMGEGSSLNILTWIMNLVINIILHILSTVTPT